MYLFMDCAMHGKFWQIFSGSNSFFSLQYVPQDMITTDMNGVEVINEEPEYNKADYYN